MKTKLLVLTTFILLCAASLQAQQRTTFGIRGGVNFQNLNGKDIDGDKLDNKLKTGFHLGVNADVPFAPDFYIQPGVVFSTKGAKSNDGDFKTNLSYVEIPVNFLYKPTLGAGKLLAGFGPYVAWAVGGNVDDNGDKTDIEFKNSITPGELISSTPYYRRFDAGANFLFGYEFSSRFFTQLNAQLGLVNINPDIEGLDEDTKVKNTGFGVSIGYRF